MKYKKLINKLIKLINKHSDIKNDLVVKESWLIKYKQLVIK